MGMAKNMLYTFNYPVATTYQALMQALSKTTKYRIINADQNANLIIIKSGVSLTSWGEDITIVVAPGLNGDSTVSIASSLKMGLFDWGKNNKNLNTIIQLLTEELQTYSTQNQPNTPPYM